MDGDQNYIPQSYDPSINKLRDIEEKQRILKDRLLLVGQNLLDTKEETNQKILEMKQELEILKKNMEKMLSFIENISEEFSKFARKEDLEILIKQAKMFQPMEFATKKDLENLRSKQ